MEILVSILSLTLLFTFLVTPFTVYRKVYESGKKYNFFAYLIVSLLITAPLGVVFVWWGHESDLILLRHYGYNIDGMNDTEFFENVKTQNLARVNELVISVMGIGWPLKAIMMLIFCLPYTLIVYFLNYLIGKRFI